jgi:phospholipid/cholesterol/gamma-HCH transport system substrate-binding protein
LALAAGKLVWAVVEPGAEADMLKDGGEIIETSGAPDLMGLIGSVVNRSGGDAPR